jgi:hypothetical protein
MIPAMRTRLGPVLATLFTLSMSATAFGQNEPKKDDGDVVFDNRKLSEEQKAEKKQENAQLFENDTPFAEEAAPDPVDLRENKWEPGFVFGGRIGYATGRGDYTEFIQSKLANNGQLFVWADVGYAPIPYLSLGLYLAGGYVLPDDCPEGVSCSGWTLRFGPEALVRFLPFQQISPMLGIGAGYEWLTQSSSTDEASIRNTFTGFEMLNIQAGIDVRRADEIFGVFLLYSMGKFNHRSLSSDLGDSSEDIDPTTTHSWIGLGLRGMVE